MPITEARKKANDKYIKNKTDELKIRVPKGNKRIIEEAAQKDGKSLNAYVVEAVDKQLIASGNQSIIATKEGE